MIRIAAIQKYKTPKGETKYRVRYRHAGKQKSKTFPTLKMAKEYKTNIEHTKLTGSYVNPNSITISELLDRWIAYKKEVVRDGVKGTIKSSTIVTYGYDAKSIKEYLGDALIQELTAADIEEMYSSYSKKYSLSRVSGMHRVMGMSMRYARKARLILSNPMDLVDAVPQGEAKVKELAYTDIPLYLECVKDSWVYLPVVLALFLGMRRGEIAALRWSEVNFEQGYILVKATEGLVDKQIVRTLPKNNKVRIVPLPQSIATLLIIHKEQTSKFAPEYVVIQPNGKRPKPNSISQSFMLRQEQANLEKVTFHSLKHTASTLMEYFKVDRKVASAILAHRSVEFTDKVYRYVFDEQMEDARDTMETQISEHFLL